MKGMLKLPSTFFPAATEMSSEKRELMTVSRLQSQLGSTPIDKDKPADRLAD